MYRVKKIHDVIDDIDVGNENIKINEESMSKEERDRVLELALNLIKSKK